jgi:Na+-driven multidrug efflux pump
MNAEETIRKKSLFSKKPKQSLNMTEGPVFWKIVRFSVPLILTGILSLFYNAADLIVVGNYAGSDALAAVTSTGSLNNLMINIFIGISTGAAVISS